MKTARPFQRNEWAFWEGVGGRQGARGGHKTLRIERTFYRTTKVFSELPFRVVVRLAIIDRDGVWIKRARKMLSHKKGAKMARPLEKTRRDGTRYTRFPEIEAAIDAAIGKTFKLCCTGLEFVTRKSRITSRRNASFT